MSNGRYFRLFPLIILQTFDHRTFIVYILIGLGDDMTHIFLYLLGQRSMSQCSLCKNPSVGRPNGFRPFSFYFLKEIFHISHAN